MINKTIVYTYYIFLNSLLILLAAYLFNWMEILEVLNKAFFLMGGILLFSVFIVSRKLNKITKLIINLIATLAFILWIFSLVEIVEFKSYALLAFQSLLFCLITSIYLKYISDKKMIFKVIYTLSFLFLMTIIELICLEYLTQNYLVISSLSIFSVLTLLLIVFRKQTTIQ